MSTRQSYPSGADQALDGSPVEYPQIDVREGGADLALRVAVVFVVVFVTRGWDSVRACPRQETRLKMNNRNPAIVNVVVFSRARGVASARGEVPGGYLSGT